MPATPILPFRINKVQIVQGSSIEPYLRVEFNIKLEKNGNNVGISQLYLLDIKTKLSVSKGSDSTQELGYAESIPSSNMLSGFGSDSTIHLYLRLSPYTIHKIEHIRDGKDLHFYCESYFYAYANVFREDGIQNMELVTLQASGNAYSFKYPRSEWIDDLGRTDFYGVELVEVPKVEFASIPLTSDVTKFIHDAERAMKEGRYGDVFGECRKAIEVLYKGIEEWGSKQQLTDKEIERINAAPSTDKINVKREIYFSRLVEHPEKGKRLNGLRVDLSNYLSLDPHEAEYKGIEFTKNDASFALRITVGFASNILSHLEYQTKKRA